MAARFQAHRATTPELVELLHVSPARVHWAAEPSRVHFPIAVVAQVVVLAVALVFVWFALAWGGVVIGTALGIPMHGGLPA